MWTLLHVFTCTQSGWLISHNKIIGNENGIPLRWDTPRYDIGFSLDGLLPRHCVY